MKTIRFTKASPWPTGRDDATTYEAGSVHTLRDDLADRWLKRGAAELFQAAPAPVVDDPADDAGGDDDAGGGDAGAGEPPADQTGGGETGRARRPRRG